MPQQQTTPNQTNTPPPDDNYTALDPKRDPIGFVNQNKDALSKMPEDKAIRFTDMLFRKYQLPKMQAAMRNSGRQMDEDETQMQRYQFIAHMFDIPFTPGSMKGEQVEKPGVVKKGAAALEAGGAGVLGGIRTFSELVAKLDKSDLSKDPIHKAIARAEKAAYEDAQMISPGTASVSAGIGHQIPAAMMAEGAGGLVPKLASRAAPTALKMAAGGARGAAEGTTYEATRPGGDPSAGAGYGGLIGIAFPLLGKLFRRGAIDSIPGERAAASATKPTEAAAGDIKDQLATKNFGKAFKDLTSAEKMKMPQLLKDEIASQQAAKRASARAAKEAKKASSASEQTATTAKKVEAAQSTAAQQAERRKSGVTSQATASAATMQNPQVAKVMETFKPGEGTSMNAPGQVIKKNVDLEIETAKHELEKNKNILKNPQATTEEKQIAKDNIKFWHDKHTELTGGKPRVTKVPEGQSGPMVRAKNGQPASPAQQAADRERISEKRDLAKKEEFGSALEKHAQSMAGKYTGKTVGIEHIPEIEEALKEFDGGDMILKSLQKIRKNGKIDDVMYVEEMKNWMLEQLSKEQ